jgi:hypothetical protein
VAKPHTSPSRCSENSPLAKVFGYRAKMPVWLAGTVELNARFALGALAHFRRGADARFRTIPDQPQRVSGIQARELRDLWLKYNIYPNTTFTLLTRFNLSDYSSMWRCKNAGFAQNSRERNGPRRVLGEGDFK